VLPLIGCMLPLLLREVSSMFYSCH
jgi:hypothetical protein